MTPSDRIEVLVDRPPRAGGEYVLYWMVANRRPRYNFALQRAVELARSTGAPLLVFEALRVGYRWASDRHHRFVLDGMRENQRAFADKGVTYLPYVEPVAGHGKGLVEALAARAVAVVTDHQPGFFQTKMQDAVAPRLNVRFERVDSVGLLPLAVTDGPSPTAYAFRRILQKTVRPHLARFPDADPLATPVRRATVPPDVLARWPAATDARLAGDVADLPIDHAVAPVSLPGGFAEGSRRWASFLDARLDRYGDDRNEPSKDGASGLSAWLHFGHLSVHEILSDLFRVESFDPDRLGPPSGSREGFWKMSGSTESFVDELVTWRELGAHYCHHQPAFDRYETLPDWARKTLEDHASDPRPHRYDLATLDAARTHDPLWNAAQRQLRSEGRIHNYLRMLWGKKVLEWSDHPKTAFETLIELNNKYALDGRDPNSYTGIAWCFGRFDRPWGPVRPIFGTIRYMSSDNTAKKMDVKPYLARWGGGRAAQLGLALR